MINNFRHKYFFLSNFYEAPVTIEGITYQNNEAAFQAHKTVHISQRTQVCNLNPSEAKQLGRRIKLRNDWEHVKEDIMYKVCLCKFTQNLDLAEKLLQTGDEYLEEGNTWGDREWGTVNGVGDNKLGKVLMKIRSQLEKQMKK